MELTTTGIQAILTANRYRCGSYKACSGATGSCGKTKGGLSGNNDANAMAQEAVDSWQSAGGSRQFLFFGGTFLTISVPILATFFYPVN